MMKKFFALCLALASLLSMTGCLYSTDRESDDLPGDIQTEIKEEPPVVINRENNDGPMGFAVRLFQAGAEADDDTLISPISVLCALAMTANGAQGETLAQMENVLGMTVPELNAYLHAYREALPTGEKYKLHLANSIWFTDDARFTVEQDFLQVNTDYYGAGIYKVPFNRTTCKEINSWVTRETDGMIEDILDEISQDAVMYLVNATAFDAEWATLYRDTQIRAGIFTEADGEKEPAEMMYSKEYYYLDDGNATGFIKHYADGKYAFVALLPNEGVTLGDYIASLTGEGLSALLTEAQQTAVTATIPKFETDSDMELSRVLAGMGMPNAFSETLADFTGISSSTDGNICISRVLHKTYIAVGEKGTKAGAATVVEMTGAAAAELTEPPKEVILDRPFVYMIIDCEENLPLFIGTLTEID